jgi:putative salt-induced outer membrane protein YdiY
MRRAAVMAALALLIAAPATAQAPEDGVRAAEAALAGAMAARDGNGLEQLIAEGFTGTDGIVLDRQAWIATLLSLCGGARVATDSIQVTPGADTALVSYEATLHRDDPCQPAISRTRVTHVWSLVDGTWRLTLRTAQPLAGAAASPPRPDGPRPSPPAWAGMFEVTVLSTRGNVNTFTFGSAGDMAWQNGPWRTDIRGAFLRTTTDVVEDRYSVNLQVRQSRQLSGLVELFGRALYQRDLFAGILRRYGADAGVGFVIVRDGQRLQATLGAGSTVEESLNAPVQSAPIATAGVQYRYNLNATTSITEDTLFTNSLNAVGNWRLESTVAFTTVLHQPLQLRTSYQAKYSNQPVPGFQPFDGILSAALTVRF